MQLKKTKLAGIISLLFCSNAMAVVFSDPPIAVLEDSSRFGPFVSAMDTSSAATATTTAINTNTYAQPFMYDIGAPWTYNEYCVYDDDVCYMFWDGTGSGGSDGFFVWRRNILSTYAGINGPYESESKTSVDGTDIAIPSLLTESRKITAMTSDNQAGYATESGSKIVRRGFYNDIPLVPLGFDDKGGFSAAHDFAKVSLTGDNGTFSPKTLIVGQASVQWANADDQSRFDYCFNYSIDDDRYDYDDLYNCPGFDLQASYWNDDGSVIAYLSNDSATNWIGTGGDAIFIANAYAINTSGFSVGFSTQQIYSSTSGGRARATIFKPTVSGTDQLSFAMTEIKKPKTDTGSDYDNVIRDTVAVDITDKTFVEASSTFVDAAGTDDPSQAFIVVGNRTYNLPQNRSYATEFYTYNVASGKTDYPLKDNPIKGANSQVSKINNDGLVVGWRDARGETSPTAEGSARFQSAFVYDYKLDKSVYLDDLYCKSINENPADGPIKYRFVNAISISDNNSDTYTIVANGFDYGNAENYKNRVGSTPVVLSMTVTQADLTDFDNSSQCPIKADEPYERSGAGMGWFVLLPTMMLLFRRFKR
ncbi:DUF3466 family protein [Moritella dasanensis]|uniref:DUF3466 family protein n=1 Tax=Moritella dasanensis TaxID=428031 RepID=UPI00037CA913|nr:DUF3466 family protein [Moritella dasanensis]